MKTSTCFFLFILSITLSACISPSVDKIANEWCECKSIEQHQSSLQGDQCLQEWDKKYGKIEFNDQQIAKFNQIILDCMNEK